MILTAGTRISHQVCKGLYLIMLLEIVHMRDSEIDQACMHDLSLCTWATSLDSRGRPGVEAIGQQVFRGLVYMYLQD